MINKKNIILLSVLLLTGILSRAPLVEHMQSHWDGPQYSIGVIRYSLEQGTPAPPGYPLYIAMGKILYTFTHDPHYALLVISVLFSGIGAVIFYLIGQKIFNNTVGIINALLFLSGPTFYYFGLTAYAYGITPAISTTLALIVFLIAWRKKHLGAFLGILCSFAIGFRIQDILFIVPLFLYGLYHLPKKQKSVAIISFIFATVLWLLPLLYKVGGLQNYIRICLNFAMKDSLPPPSLIYPFINRMTLVKGVFLSFGIGLVALLFYPYKLIKKRKILLKNSKIILFFCLWILPSLLFNLFVRSDHAGHQMTYLSGLSLLIAYAWWRIAKNNKGLLVFFITIVILFNLFTFFRDRDPSFMKPYVATSFHYSEIRKNDIKLGGKISYVKAHFPPQSTLIITSSYLWRPIMYYLRQYQVDNLEALVTTDPQYKDIRRDAMDWNIKEYAQKDHVISLPENIRTIILFDDNANSWVKNSNVTVIYLPGNSSISVVMTHPGIRYGYNYARFEKNDN